MADPKIIKGKNLRILVTDPKDSKVKKIFHSTSCSISISPEISEFITKDTDGAKQKEYKGYDWSLSSENVAVDDASGEEALTFVDMLGMVLGEKKVAVSFELSGSYNKKYRFKGNAIISDLSSDAPADDNVTFSAELSGDGPLTLEMITE